MRHAYDRLFLYGLLATLFRQPEKDLLELLNDEEMQVLQHYLPGMGVPELPVGTDDEIIACLQQEYDRLSVAAPMQASSYREREFTAMNDLYERIGLEPDEDAPPIDLLPMELELLVLLADLEAEAEDAGRDGEVDRAHALHRAVVDEHLENWIPLWCREARKAKPIPFYAWAIDLLVQVLDNDRTLNA